MGHSGQLFTTAARRQKNILKKKSGYREELNPPPAKCLPYETYLRLYGDPKKNGHKVQKSHGKKIVVIPPGPDDMWTLQPIHSAGVEQEEDLHNEDESDAVDCFSS